MINYDRRGSGEPLLLIHGIGSRWQIWEPLLDALAEEFDVIALDLPGFGASPRLDGAMTVAGLVDEVEKFCMELGIERPHIAGNSMGGGIGLELARRGLARSVTAFSPIGFWGRLGLVWTKAALRAGRAALRPLRPVLPRLLHTKAGRIAALGLAFGRPTQADPDAALADVEGLLDAPAFDEVLASFDEFDVGRTQTVPTTVAWGSRDILLTYATQSRRARTQLPAARHVTMRGCGHTPFADDPQACIDLITAQRKAGTS